MPSKNPWANQGTGPSQITEGPWEPHITGKKDNRVNSVEEGFRPAFTTPTEPTEPPEFRPDMVALAAVKLEACREAYVRGYVDAATHSLAMSRTVMSTDAWDAVVAQVQAVAEDLAKAKLR